MAGGEQKLQRAGKFPGGLSCAGCLLDRWVVQYFLTPGLKSKPQKDVGSGSGSSQHSAALQAPSLLSEGITEAHPEESAVTPLTPGWCKVPGFGEAELSGAELSPLLVTPSLVLAYCPCGNTDTL